MLLTQFFNEFSRCDLLQLFLVSFSKRKNSKLISNVTVTNNYLFFITAYIRPRRDSEMNKYV